MTSPATSHISIIIPTLNEETLLGELLSSLQGYPELEVIVVDGGSRDRTLEIAKSYPFCVLQAQPGRSLQQNFGALNADRPVLLFLHCDTRLPDDFPAQVLAVLNQPGTAAGAFRFKINARGYRYRLIEWGVNLRARRFGRPYGDQALFMKKHIFNQAGEFPDQPFLEDLELVRRLRRIGRIAIAPGHATTSARRWKHLGVLRTTVINQVILLGYRCGINAATLRRFYFPKNRGKSDYPNKS